MKLSDIHNSICIDSSVENKNCILLKIVFYLIESCKCSGRKHCLQEKKSVASSYPQDKERVNTESPLNALLFREEFGALLFLGEENR